MISLKRAARAALCAALVSTSAIAHAAASQPNIVVIMGDDIGWLNMNAS